MTSVGWRETAQPIEPTRRLLAAARAKIDEALIPGQLSVGRVPDMGTVLLLKVRPEGGLVRLLQDDQILEA